MSDQTVAETEIRPVAVGVQIQEIPQQVYDAVEAAKKEFDIWYKHFSTDPKQKMPENWIESRALDQVLREKCLNELYGLNDNTNPEIKRQIEASLLNYLSDEAPVSLTKWIYNSHSPDFLINNAELSLLNTARNIFEVKEGSLFRRTESGLEKVEIKI